MSYEHQRWDNRVFLYGWAGKLARDNIMDRGPEKGILHVGWWLKVTNTSARTGRVRQTLLWCKARHAFAEAIKLEFTSPRWMRVEGTLMMWNGNSASLQFNPEEGKYAFTFIEVKHLWWEEASGRQNSTVVLTKSEHDRLRKIEEAWKTGRSRFHIPRAKAVELKYLYDDEEEGPKKMDEPGPSPDATTIDHHSNPKRKPKFDPEVPPPTVQ